MTTAEKIAKNTFYNSVATYVNYPCSLILSIVLARGLGAEQYGVYVFFLWFLSLLAMAVNLGLGQMALKYVSEATGRAKAGETEGVVRLALWVKVAATLLLVVLALVLSPRLAQAFGYPKNIGYFLIIAVTAFPYALTQLFQSLFGGFQRYNYIAYQALATYPVRAITATMLVTLGFGVMQLFGLEVAIWTGGVLLSLFLLNRLVPLRRLLAPPGLDSQIRSRAQKYALAMMALLALNFIVWERSEVFFLTAYRSLEEVAYFNLAAKLPGILMNLFPYVLGGVLIPAISEEFGRGDLVKLRAIYTTASRYLMMLAFPVTAAGIVLAAPLTSLLYGAEYAPAVAPMRLLFLAGALGSIKSSSSAVIFGTNQTGFLIKQGLLLTGVWIGLCLLLVPRYGPEGAALTAIAAYGLAISMNIWFVSRKVGTSWPWKSTLRIGLAGLVMALGILLVQSLIAGLWGLVLSVLAGAGLYLGGLVALRALGPEDLRFIGRLEDSLPSCFRKNYRAFSSLLGRVLLK